MGWDSPIIRVSSGYLNTVNDTVVAGQASIGSRSRFGGQLGKTIYFDSENIGAMADTSVGTLYAGLYQYVLLSADSAAIAVGEVLYWDQTAGTAAFQVSRTATVGVTFTASAIAGIALNVITPGNYGFIFIGHGLVDMLFVASITGTKATGRPVYVDASTVNRVNVLDTDPAVQPARFMGWAVTAPADNALDTVNMQSVRSPRS